MRVNLKGQRVLVVGLGRSGVAAARFCAAQGSYVVATDLKKEKDLTEAVRALDNCATLELGEHRRESFVNADLIVVSPGVPPMEQIEAAKKIGVPVFGEIELSSRFVEAPIVAVTGTNGKSTTTTLIGEMIKASGKPTFCGGNLGQPLAEAIGSECTGPNGVVVLELSSFQLETVEKFCAHIAVLLNFSEDHLDRYATYEDYLSAKARIFERQTTKDYAIINGNLDQKDCRKISNSSCAKVVSFCSVFDQQQPNDCCGWLQDDRLLIKLPGLCVEEYPRETLKLPGRHNSENALAALIAARLAGVDQKTCANSLSTFCGLEHRMEFVRELNGVRYYNDSKATNVGSVVGSLSGFERPVVLIAGGKDKGGDYAPMAKVLALVCRHVVLIGAAAQKMAKALEGSCPIHLEKDLPSAVQKASKLAQPGDAVILSPACSSYDMFKNFEERGKVFALATKELS